MFEPFPTRLPHTRSLRRTCSLFAACSLSITSWMACSSDADVVESPTNNPDASTHTDAANDGLISPDAGPCKQGNWVCEGNTAKQCDGNGGFSQTRDCSSVGVCAPVVGCTICTPYAGSCTNNVATYCTADGTGYKTIYCDPVQGMVCEPSGCTGKCSPKELANSYYGCDYFPTVTLNPVWNGFDFAVAVANTADSQVDVAITRGDTVITNDTIEAKGIKTFELPWVTELKGPDQDQCMTPLEPGPTALVTKGAYRLRTNLPVTVYQFSPLEYKFDPKPANCPVGTDCPGGVIADCLSYTNDASLLLPVNTWTGDYFVTAWPSAKDRAGFATITASEDSTTVELVGAGEFSAGAGIAATGDGTVVLNAGDVLQVLARHDTTGGVFGPDLSGTRVHADKPVQVIGGHSCGNVPEPTTMACDHLEHAMFPIEALGSDYIVTFPSAVGGLSPHVIRVLAIEAATKVVFDPAILPETTLEPGGAPLEIKEVNQDVRIYSPEGKPLLISQFMQGQDSVSTHQGDPSMALAIPSAQFRTNYIFVAPASYNANFVNVIAPAVADVSLDGAVIPKSQFTAVGSTGFTVARVELSGPEQHSISSSIAFGILVYGYGSYTSYMYPGGLDLKHISQVPPVVK